MIAAQETDKQPLSRAARKRAEIIHAGSRLMYQQGYHGTSIKDIVNAAGIPKGSFYNYFSSKEEFTMEALEYYTQSRLQEFCADLNNSSISPANRIGTIFRSNPDRFSSREFTPMSFMSKISTELKISHPVIGDMINNLFNAFRDAIANCLSEAQSNGEIASTKDVTKLADFILYAWHGALLHADDPDDKNAIEDFCLVLERDLLV
jgi:TetR/AcrR family transcriptional repressor of nem operon